MRNSAGSFFRSILPELTFFLVGLLCLFGLAWLVQQIQEGVGKTMPVISNVLQERASGVNVSDFIGLLALTAAFAFRRANSYFHLRAAEQAQKCLDEALAELASRIKARVDNPDLMTSQSIRSLALVIEHRYKCPIITDLLIAEAIRSAAFELEKEISGSALVLRLEILNRLLKHFDVNSSPLLSIAVVDRLTAYRFAQPWVMTILFFGLMIITALGLFNNQSIFVVVGFGLFLLPMGILMIGSKRAVFFWGSPGIANATEQNRFLRQMLSPQQPLPFIDIFFSAAISRSSKASVFWHNLMGPLWENVLARNFLRSHQYRVTFAEELEEQLRQEKRRLVNAVKAGQEPQIQWMELCRLYRRLWEVTGEDRYRTQAHKMASASKALRDQIIQEISVMVDDERFPAKLLSKSLEERCRAFFRALANGVAPEAEVESLKEIIRAANLLWEKTADRRYRQIADDSANLLSNYEATGRFYTIRHEDQK